MLDKIIFKTQAQRHKVTEYYNKCISEGHKVTFFCGNEIRTEDYQHFKQTCNQFEPYSDDEMSAVNWFEEKLFFFIGLTVCSLLSLNMETEQAFKSLKRQSVPTWVVSEEKRELAYSLANRI